MKSARIVALLALVLSAAFATPAAAVQPGDVVIVRDGPTLFVRFPGVSRREWRDEIANHYVKTSCFTAHAEGAVTNRAPRRRRTMVFPALGSKVFDWCVVTTELFRGERDQELAVRGFTAEGRRLVDERAAVGRAASALTFFNRVHANDGRYPTDAELAAFSRGNFPLIRLAAPDAAPPANGAGVFLDASIERVRAVATGGGRIVFLERIGIGDSATFSTNALRWYDELVGGLPV
jgi:hypothetical protein